MSKGKRLSGGKKSRGTFLIPHGSAFYKDKKKSAEKYGSKIPSLQSVNVFSGSRRRKPETVESAVDDANIQSQEDYENSIESQTGEQSIAPGSIFTRAYMSIRGYFYGGNR